MRRIVLIFLGVLAVLVALVVILPFVVPVDAYRSRIEAEATQATGRQLKIDGALHLTVFPELGLKAEKVTLANVPGGKAPYLATMQSLRVGVRLMPLLSGRLEVSEVTLDKPTINLEADKAGHGNWVLGGKAAAKQTSPAETAGGGVAAAAKARFQGVRIAGGTISYYDAQTGATRKIENIDLTVGITSLAKPLTVDGSLVTQGQKISLDGRIDSLKDLMDGDATPVNLSLTSTLVQASFKGRLARASADGLLKLDTPSVRKLAAWSGKALPPGGGLGHLSLEGQLSARGKTDRFSAIKLTLDKMTLTGALTLDRSGSVPALNGRLSVDDLNLNPYLAGAASGNAAAAQQPAPAKSGTGWSKKPIDLAMLKAMNARLTLNVGSLELRKLKLGQTTLVVNLQNGALTSRLDPITLYGGSGVATLNVSANGAVPHIADTLKFENLQIKPFLTDTLGIDRIEGTGTVTLNIDADGRSPDAIMHDLGGKGAITFLNGRVRGVDLAGVARTIQGALSGQSVSSSASTDFTEMGGTFTIQKGVMTSKDFHMLSPFIRLTGAGNVNLGEQSIDFVVEPKAVASMKGQGGQQGASGIGIPFRIHGAWSNIHYTPDLSGVATDILNSVKSGKFSTKSVLDGLFGGGQQTDQKPGDKTKKSTQPKNPADMLKGLFGGGG